MLYASGLTAQIVVIPHVLGLRPEHPKVQRMVVTLDFVLVVNDFTQLELASEMPLGHSAVNVERLSRLRIAALRVAAHGSFQYDIMP